LIKSFYILIFYLTFTKQFTILCEVTGVYSMRLVRGNTGYKISDFVYYKYCMIQNHSAHSTVVDIHNTQGNILWGVEGELRKSML